MTEQGYDQNQEYRIDEVIRVVSAFDSDLGKDEEFVKRILNIANDTTTNTRASVWDVYGVNVHQEGLDDIDVYRVDFLPDSSEKSERIAELQKGILSVIVLVELGALPKREYVVGTTNEVMARFAKKRLGFTDMEEYAKLGIVHVPNRVTEALEYPSYSNLHTLRAIYGELKTSDNIMLEGVARHVLGLIDEIELRIGVDDDEKHIEIIARYDDIVAKYKELIKHSEVLDIRRARNLAKQVIQR